MEAGLTGTIQQIFHEADVDVWGIAGGASHRRRSHSQRVFVGELNKSNGTVPSEFRWLESGLARREDLSG